MFWFDNFLRRQNNSLIFRFLVFRRSGVQSLFDGGQYWDPTGKAKSEAKLLKISSRYLAMNKLKIWKYWQKMNKKYFKMFFLAEFLNFEFWIAEWTQHSVWDWLSLWTDLPFDYIRNRYLLALSPHLNAFLDWIAEKWNVFLFNLKYR